MKTAVVGCTPTYPFYRGLRVKQFCGVMETLLQTVCHSFRVPWPNPDDFHARKSADICCDDHVLMVGRDWSTSPFGYLYTVDTANKGYSYQGLFAREQAYE